MADTSQPVPAEPIRVTVQAAVAAGELRQLANGKPGAYRGSYGISSGNAVSYWPKGQYVVPKTTGIVLLDGGRAYWDHSADKVTFRKNGDRDFFLGTMIGDAASGDTECTVLFGEESQSDYDLFRDAANSTPVGTASLGTGSVAGFGYPVRIGGSYQFEHSSAVEAQKVDLLSVNKFNPATANAIVEFAFRRASSTTSAAHDFNIGLANSTHATDFDSISEYLALHIDGNSNTNYIQAKDNVTTLAATTTATVHTSAASTDPTDTDEWWFDLRDPASVKIYQNAVRVLAATTITVANPSVNWRLIVHSEKTSANDAPKFLVDWLRARTAEQ